MSLYQSPIRKTLQKDIYGKSTFSIKIFGKDHFGTVKTKSFFGINFKRYQIMGLEIDMDNEAILEAVQQIKDQFGQSFTNIFFQRGITTKIVSFDLRDQKEPEFSEDLRDSRLFMRKHFEKSYGIIPSFRENMPESGIFCDFTKDNETLLKEMKESSRERVQKGIKRNIEFREAEEGEYEACYLKRQETAGKKGFNIIPKDQYYTLITYIKSHNVGTMFITKEKDDILSGTICLFNDKHIVGLYSFTDRNHTNRGGQQYAKFMIYNRARERGFTTYDTMGGAPTGFPEHELASVSAFKESMGGYKTEYIGNFDIILNKPLYKLFKWYYNKKH